MCISDRELKVPHMADMEGLRHLAPTLAAYALSFVFVGIYWNNHHHMFHLVHKVDGAVLWANLHLLFWLSLLPFTTAWVGEHLADPLPTALYGVVFWASGIAWLILA